MHGLRTILVAGVALATLGTTPAMAGERDRVQVFLGIVIADWPQVVLRGRDVDDRRARWRGDDDDDDGGRDDDDDDDDGGHDDDD